MDCGASPATWMRNQNVPQTNQASRLTATSVYIAVQARTTDLLIRS